MFDVDFKMTFEIEIFVIVMMLKETKIYSIVKHHLVRSSMFRSELNSLQLINKPMK